MEKREVIDLADEVSALVKSSLEPPYIPNMGAGSAMDNMQRAKWRTQLQSRLDIAYDIAVGVSPEAVRILYVVAAERGLTIKSKPVKFDHTSSALFAVLC